MKQRLFSYIIFISGCTLIACAVSFVCKSCSGGSDTTAGRANEELSALSKKCDLKFPINAKLISRNYLSLQSFDSLAFVIAIPPDQIRQFQLDNHFDVNLMTDAKNWVIGIVPSNPHWQPSKCRNFRSVALPSSGNDTNKFLTICFDDPKVTTVWVVWAHS